MDSSRLSLDEPRSTNPRLTDKSVKLRTMRESRNAKTARAGEAMSATRNVVADFLEIDATARTSCDHVERLEMLVDARASS
jgi:hypothetical protein